MDLKGESKILSKKKIFIGKVQGEYNTHGAINSNKKRKN